MTELHGVAIITGAASGIGRATAIAFAQAGCLKLTLVDLQERGLTEVRRLILTCCPEAQVTLRIGNTTDEQFMEVIVTRTIEANRRLDYAVNCAGTLGLPATSHEVNLEDHDRVMNVNYRGTFLSSRAELCGMLKNEPSASEDVFYQRGAIVNIASTWGLVGTKGFPAYSASKGAVIALTRADAVDYSAHKIRVNCICPGPIDTPLATFNGDAEVIKKLDEFVHSSVPLKRMGRPEDIANAAVFLCSKRASYIQGHALPVDGGYTMM